MRAAGDGAEEQARRSAERVVRERAALVEQQRRLAAAEEQERRWRAGAEGERATAAALEALVPDGWLLLHDVRWPGRPRANLDHVVVGPGGVVVVDAKNWSTPVRVRDGVLWAGRHGKTYECEAAASAAAAVGALLRPEHRHLSRAALCLVQQELEGTPVEAGVVVAGLRQVAPAIRSMRGVLTATEVAAVHGHLVQVLGASSSPAVLTTAALDRRPLARPRRSRSRPSAAAQRRTTRQAARRRRALMAAAAALVLLWGYPQWVGAIADAVGTGLEQTPPAEPSVVP